MIDFEVQCVKIGVHPAGVHWLQRAEVDELLASGDPYCPLCGERVELAVPCGGGREAEPPIYPQGLRFEQRSSAESFDGSAENSSSSLVEASDGFELETPQHSVLEVRTQLDRLCIENKSEEGAMSNEDGRD